MSIVPFGVVTKPGGGYCGCCCSNYYPGTKESVGAACQSDTGGCRATCQNGNTANQNANLNTATNRQGWCG